MAKFAKIIHKNNENLLIEKFIRHFKYQISGERKRFTFVLTGGDSPINLYRKLSFQKNIPWKKIDFFIGGSGFKPCMKPPIDFIFKISKSVHTHLNYICGEDFDFPIRV